MGDLGSDRVSGGNRLLTFAIAAVLLFSVGTTMASTVETEDHDDDGLDVGVAFLPDRPFTDEEIELRWAVFNERSTTIENVTVEIIVDDETVENRSIGTMDPLSYELFSIERSPFDAGRHSALAQATATIPAENDTTVRSWASDTALVTERNRSDLVPAELTVSPYDAYPSDPHSERKIVEGEPVRFSWSLANVGEGYPASSLGVLQLDGEQLDQWTFGRLMPSDRGIIEHRPGFDIVERGLEAGEHTATVVADPYDAEPELDETNNERSQTFTVLGKADPAVAGIDVERSNLTVVGQEGPPNPWAERDVTVTVASGGPGPVLHAGWVQALVCPDRGQATGPDGDCRFLDEWELPEIAAGAEEEFVTEWDPRGSVGDYEICTEIHYERPEVQLHDNEACQDTSVVVGNTGLGGR